MALRDLQTNLKSLGYGKDRKGGGSSNQPYIQTPIPDGDAPSSPDFLLRNGYLNPISSLQDVSRLTKFFSPFGPGASANGVLFIAKQELLERQGVDVVDGINRIYNPLGTLAQAGVLSIGYHLNKQGINVFRNGYFNGGKDGYFEVTKLNNEVDINRLTGLFNTNKQQKFDDILSISEYGLNTTPNSQILFSYSGGPGSILGIGKTNIRLWNSTNKIKIPEKSSTIAFSTIIPLTPNRISTVWNYNPGAGINQKYNVTGLFQSGVGVSFLTKVEIDPTIPNSTLFGNAENASDVLNRNTLTSNTFTSTTPGYLTYEQIQRSANETKDNRGTVTDFREYLPDVPKTDYSAIGFNRENGGDGYGYNTSKTYFKSNSRNGITRILNPNLAISPDQVEIGVRGEDIIDFNFTLVNNKGDKTDRNTLIDFRAYVEDFNDSFTGEWDAYRYNGRAENFYKYKGFNREFSLTFVVPNLSRADMISSYQKLNALSWTTMPDYSEAGLMRGNLCYFTMGDYLRRSLVVVKSLSYTPIMEMGFDIDRDIDGRKFANGQDSLYVGQLPKGIKVQCSLIPLTNEVSPQIFYTPQRGEAFIGNRTHAIVDRDNIAKQYVGGKQPEDFQSEAAGQYNNSYIASSPYQSPTYVDMTNTRTRKTIVEDSTVPPPQQIIPQPLPGLNTTPLLSNLPNFASQFSDITENTGEEGPQLPIDAIPTGIEGNFLLNTNAPAGPRV
jgi:hypothetical protein